METLVFSLFMVLSIVLALMSRRGHSNQSSQDFFVASRQFGAFLVFFLSAGEIYSINTMIGFPGGIYAKGASYGIWFMGYVLLSYPVGYFLGPKIWAAGKRYNAITLPDLYKGHFGSRAVEVIAAIGAILFVLPWGQLQFTGLLFALKGMGWGLKPDELIGIAACFAFAYVAIAGVRASAFIAIMKDILMVVAILIVGAAVASKVGVEPVFKLAATKVSNTINSSQLPFAMSTMLFQSLGFYMFPFNVQSLFTAKSANTIRRTQIVMPLYMLMFPFLIVVTYFAISRGIHLDSPNDAFFAAAAALLPGWLLGLIEAGAALSGLVVLAGICLVIGPIVTRNLMPNLPESKQKAGAKAVIILYLVLSIFLTLFSSNLMVTIANTAYFGVTQFLPGVLVVVFGIRIRGSAVAAGLVTGQVLAIAMYLSNITFGGINVGFLALLANCVVIGLLHLVLGKKAAPTFA
ncbi:sodium:solute symporter family protein [Paraburkholderia fungorum]|jgi:solute:Na+ symporter, SSS family|uniref:sodium:solute symporter family protein n=1 Tax=Paraburkholderia fungorum TaxID=134537 RepID=UPI0038BBC207